MTSKRRPRAPASRDSRRSARSDSTPGGEAPHVLADRDEQIRNLEAEVIRLRSRESNFRDLLLDAHEQLVGRDEHLAGVLAATQDTLAGSSAASRATGSMRYHDLVAQVRHVVSSVVPQGSTVLMVSKGDPELLDLGQRTGWHFPQAENGVYAGYYPADGASAISHLEDLQARGAQFIVFPATAMWWLERYQGLRPYLETGHRKVFEDKTVAAVFELSFEPRVTSHRAGAAQPLSRFRRVARFGRDIKTAE